MLVAPLVTDVDRKWALRQRPAWFPDTDRDEALPEIVDDGAWLDSEAKAKLPPPNWSQFVSEQVEAFEKFFIGQRKTYAEWSRIWRKTWWPKANPSHRFPKSAPVEVHPFFRHGTPEFARAMTVATDGERRVWKRFGCQMHRDDDRLKFVRGEAA